MKHKVECDGYHLSIIGGEDRALNDPITGPLLQLAETLRPDDFPSFREHGDGVNTWEVAVRRDGRPQEIFEWTPYLMPWPMSNEDWVIYGQVPTEVIQEWVEGHGGQWSP